MKKKKSRKNTPEITEADFNTMIPNEKAIIWAGYGTAGGECYLKPMSLNRETLEATLSDLINLSEEISRRLKGLEE